MGMQAEGNRALFSTSRYQSAVASTAVLVAKITAAQFAGVSPSQEVLYHVTWVPGAAANTVWQLLQVRGSTTITDPANAAVQDSMVVQTLANQSWNYDAYMKIAPNDNLYVTMPFSSASTAVAVKIYAEPLI